MAEINDVDVKGVGSLDITVPTTEAPVEAGELHPSQVPDYEPRFDRFGTNRRVLGHITPAFDIAAGGPRNTLDGLTRALVADEHTKVKLVNEAPDGSTLDAVTKVKGHLAELISAGLVEQADDGSYAVTAAGAVELAN